MTRDALRKLPVGTLMVNWEFPEAIFRLDGLHGGNPNLTYVSGAWSSWHCRLRPAGPDHTNIYIPLLIALPQGI